MAQVAVTIAGRVYRMACGDGEEAHLEGLALDLDSRITSLRESFGEIGDMRITVMAAITLADERKEALDRITHLEREVARLRAAHSVVEQATDGWVLNAARGIEDAAARIEGVVQILNAPGRE